MANVLLAEDLLLEEWVKKKLSELTTAFAAEIEELKARVALLEELAKEG